MPEQPVPSRKHGLTAIDGALALIALLLIVQMWLLTGQLSGWKVSGQWRVATTSVRALEASGRMRGRSRRLDPRFHG